MPTASDPIVLPRDANAGGTQPPAVVGGAQAPAIVGRVRAALALSLLLGLQPITTDVYLPALPMLTRVLGAPVAAAQLTMSALILAFGIAQLVWGPVADRIGRRPVLLVGLALYTAASVVCALAPSIELLVAARAVQGVALATAVVCARATLRDLYEPAEGAAVMARAMTGLGVLALAGPLVGGLMADATGWRGPLALVAAVGAAVWLFVALRLPETIRVRNPHATDVRPLLRTWGAMLRHRVFMAWALLVAAAYGGLFTVLAASSFTYIDVLGLTPAAYGLAMALGSLVYIAGTLLCKRWIARHGMVGTVRRAACFTLVGGVSIALLAVAGVQTWWAVLLPQCLFVFGHGMHQPCGQAGVVGPFPHAAGAAAALAGAMLALVAFGVGSWLGTALDGSTRALGYGLGLWSLATCAAAWVLVPRAVRVGDAVAVAARAEAGD
jgi:MFS transporter, DHA1 family, multidrug resistance protein